VNLEVDAHLGAPPSDVWSWITDPERLNRWSLAKAELLANGEDGTPGSVGARRIMTARTGPVAWHMHERVLEATPASRYVYEVRPFALLRHHHGEIDLDAAGAGTSLTWTVGFTLWLPPLEPLFASAFRRQLDASLANLTRLLEPPRPTG
jgi:hypothetical protein